MLLTPINRLQWNSNSVFNTSLVLSHAVTSSSAVAERPRDDSAILRGCVILRLNFRLKG